jgi:hypothetical protein
LRLLAGLLVLPATSSRWARFAFISYIHDLNTVCDPAGDVRELFRLQVENRMLRWECERLAQKAGERPQMKTRAPVKAKRAWKDRT